MSCALVWSVRMSGVTPRLTSSGSTSAALPSKPTETASPARVAVSLTDYITGLYGAFGAVMAILAQRQTGRGQVIDTAFIDRAPSFRARD